MGRDLGELRKRFIAACQGLGDEQARGELFDRLIAAYTNTGRHYHGIDHIADCLREFDTVEQHAQNACAVELAIWFHDVVYEGNRTDNELRSADTADVELSKLGADQALRNEVRRLIILTQHDQPPAKADVDGSLIVDIDLSSLALPATRFAENTRLIRLEYPHVGNDDFQRGRRAMFEKFLARPRIYYTDILRDRHEQAARENLSRAIQA